MTILSEASALIQLLQLPAADLPSLSFCKSSRIASVKDWVEHLPVTQINRTASMLYRAIPEIAKLGTSAGNRLQMLELLRPYAQQNLQGLTRSFIDQPLLHSEEAMKIAIISQAIQRSMSQAYGQAAEDILRGRPKGNFKSAEKKSLALALHRTLSGLGLQLLRYAQIYSQPPAGLWQKINSLYRIAEKLDLLDIPCPDSLLKARATISLQQAYQRILLLACARTNQLSPREIEQTFELTESCCTLVQLTSTPAGERDLFAVDLTADAAPIYRSSMDHGAQSAGYRYLQLSRLLDTIVKQLAQQDSANAVIDIPTNLAPSLLQHLQRSWGEILQRSNPRNTNHATLEVAVGLTSIHYHLAGQKSFRDFMRSTVPAGSEFGLREDNNADPWDSAFDSEGLGRTEFELGTSLNAEKPAQAGATAKPSPFAVHRVQMLDFSSEGMRIDWRGEIPAQVKTGEILSLVEAGQTPRIGVVRWARQHKHGSLLGIEILSHRSQPAAAQVIRKGAEDNVFMHALLVAPGRGNGDAEQLITAAHPFRSGSRVRIRDRDSTFTAVLTEQQVSTASISRFRFRPQETASGTLDRGEGGENESFAREW